MEFSYKKNLDGIETSDISSFFVGWPNPPQRETFIKLLKGSYRVIMALDDNKLVGFITAISDGVLSAYIPLLEVLPEYQKKGIGIELVNRMKNELREFYMVDLLCDSELIPYYERLGFTESQGAVIRNYDKQSGRSE